MNASGSVDRKAMQALEKIGVLEQDEERGGRRITTAGQRDLDREFFPSSLNYRNGVGSRSRETYLLTIGSLRDRADHSRGGGWRGRD